jgi:hypothetical protein
LVGLYVSDAPSKSNWMDYMSVMHHQSLIGWTICQ